MIAFTAFKTAKPRGFNYVPRYFDPEKEAREQRRRDLLGDDACDQDIKEGSKAYRPGQYIGELRIRRGIISKGRNKGVTINKTRIVLLVAMVVIICVWLFM